jgi:mRNA interferase MazF
VVSRGDIVYIELPPPPGGAGHEQSGSRPALVVHNDATSSSLSVIMVVPLTSKLRAHGYPHTILVDPTPQNGLTCQSVLLVFQLRAVDKRRVRNIIGRLDAALLTQVEDEMRLLLSL